METRDKYQGCPEEIAQALKDGKHVKGFGWDEIEDIEECWLESYYFGLTEPFIIIRGLGRFGYAKHFSLTDPRKPKKITTIEDALSWAEKNPWEVIRQRDEDEDVLWVARELYEDTCVGSMFKTSTYEVLTSKDPEEWTPLTEIEI